MPHLPETWKTSQPKVTQRTYEISEVANACYNRLLADSNRRQNQKTSQRETDESITQNFHKSFREHTPIKYSVRTDRKSQRSLHLQSTTSNHQQIKSQRSLHFQSTNLNQNQTHVKSTSILSLRESEKDHSNLYYRKKAHKNTSNQRSSEKI